MRYIKTYDKFLNEGTTVNSPFKSIGSKTLMLNRDLPFIIKKSTLNTMDDYVLSMDPTMYHFFNDMVSTSRKVFSKGAATLYALKKIYLTYIIDKKDNIVMIPKKQAAHWHKLMKKAQVEYTLKKIK